MKKIIEKAKDESAVASALLTVSLSVLGYSSITLTKWWQYIIAFFSICVLYLIFYITTREVIKVYTKYFERPDTSVCLNEEFDQLKSIIHLLKSESEKYNTLPCTDNYKKILKQEITYQCLLSTNKIKLIENYIVQNVSLSYYNDLGFRELMHNYEEYCKNLINTIK